jgi:hypothetical protein
MAPMFRLDAPSRLHPSGNPEQYPCRNPRRNALAVFAAYVQSLEHRLMAVAGAVEHDIMPQWNSRLPTPWRNKICDLTVMGQRIACRISDVLI